MGLVLRVAQCGLSPKSLAAVLSLFNEGDNLVSCLKVCGFHNTIYGDEVDNLISLCNVIYHCIVFLNL